MLPIESDKRIQCVEMYLPGKVRNLIDTLYNSDPSRRGMTNEIMESLPIRKKFSKISAVKMNETENTMSLLLSDGLNQLTEIAEGKSIDDVWNSAHAVHQPHVALGLNTGIGGTLLGFLAIAVALNKEDDVFPFVDEVVKRIESILGSKNNLKGLFTGTTGAALALGAAYNVFNKKEYLEQSYGYLSATCNNKNQNEFFGGSAGMV